MLVLSAGAVLVGWDWPALSVASLLYLIGVALAASLLPVAYPHARLGICNLVTLARWAFVAALAAPLLAPAQGWVVLALAIFALSLDGVDGWAARRSGLSSDFGARFDMEVDAALGLILALNVWAMGTTGAWVLVLGLPRYLFIAAGWVWPWMTRPLLPRFTRKIACVVQLAGLILLLAPPVTGPWASVTLTLSAVVLLSSFGRDTLWLFHARHKPLP